MQATPPELAFSGWKSATSVRCPTHALWRAATLTLRRCREQRTRHLLLHLPQAGEALFAVSTPLTARFSVQCTQAEDTNRYVAGLRVYRAAPGPPPTLLISVRPRRRTRRPPAPPHAHAVGHTCLQFREPDPGEPDALLFDNFQDCLALFAPRHPALHIPLRAIRCAAIRQRPAFGPKLTQSLRPRPQRRRLRPRRVVLPFLLGAQRRCCPPQRRPLPR